MTGSAGRGWVVLLLGGPSGAGKTSVSYRLARHFGVALTEVDDLHLFLTKLSTPSQFPAMHFWTTQAPPESAPPEAIVDGLIAVSRELAPGIESVIANHLESGPPVILEGDFLLPELGALSEFEGQPAAGRVRSLFVVEPDEAQLLANFAAREPRRPTQAKRAVVGRLYGEWLRSEATRTGADVIEARPWDTVLERAIAALNAYS